MGAARQASHSQETEHERDPRLWALLQAGQVPILRITYCILSQAWPKNLIRQCVTQYVLCGPVHIVTSTLRWDESRFRIPESERSACLALCRLSFQPGSRHIAESPVDRQEVWTVDSESTGQVF